MSGVPVLLLSGPVGVGKTTVGHELSELLEARGVAHSFVDLDALTQTYPRPADDPHGMRLALAALLDLWRHATAAGSERLVVSMVVASAADVADVAKCIADARITVCQLMASDEVLAARVRRRELGSGYEHHLRRALELSRQLSAASPADVRISTDDRTPAEIAGEMLRLCE